MPSNRNKPMLRLMIAIMFCAAALVAAWSTTAMAATAVATTVCPFCSAVNMTFAEQLRSNDVVVVAELTELPELVQADDEELPKAKFRVQSVLKGKEFVTSNMNFQTLLVGRYPVGQKFLVMGVDPPDVSWSTPMKTNDRVFQYLVDIQKLPKGGADRLAFFQKYFEDEESVLAFDAYDEFALAPYEDLIALKERMDHDQLMEWIQDPEISVDRRRLYFTMLGVCGKKEDAKILEEMIKSGDRKKQAGLDALVACYLCLTGDEGVDLIEETFLKDKSVDYVDTLASVSALRFHGTELERVSKGRIVKAIRNLLDRPKMADMIIPDLARWKDWTVMEKLVQMFKDADEDTNWLRVPVITYLRACPKPEAKKYIEELAAIDPDAVKRADFFLNFADDDEEDEDDDEEEEEEASEDKDEADEQDGLAPQPENVNFESGQSADTDPEITDREHVVARRVAIQTRAIQEEGSQTNPKGPSDVYLDRDEISSESGTTETFTSAPADSMAEPSSVDQVAQTTPGPVPVAATQPQYNYTWRVIFLPMLASFLIFLLLWCVINGWFERLIF